MKTSFFKILFLNKELTELVNGKLLRHPLRIEMDKEENKVKFNGYDIDTYEKQNALVGA